MKRVYTDEQKAAMRPRHPVPGVRSMDEEPERFLPETRRIREKSGQHALRVALHEVRQGDYAEAWWSGELLREYGAASPMLYEFGGWEIARLGIGTVRRIRA